MRALTRRLDRGFLEDRGYRPTRMRSIGMLFFNGLATILTGGTRDGLDVLLSSPQATRFQVLRGDGLSDGLPGRRPARSDEAGGISRS